MKSTLVCLVRVGKNENGPDLVSKAGEGTPRGQTLWGSGDRWELQAGSQEWRVSVGSRRGRGASGGRFGASKDRQLEEIGLQGGAGFPVKGGQNSREGTGSGLSRLPGFK